MRTIGVCYEARSCHVRYEWRESSNIIRAGEKNEDSSLPPQGIALGLWLLLRRMT